MRKFTLWAVTLALVFTGAIGGARAAGDLYTVDKVEVDASGTSTSEARDIALSRGRTKALELLFRRLTPESYWNLLPSYEGSDAVVLERGFQVSNEKSSATRYLADVTYSFQPDKIRAELEGRGIPYTEVQARTAVVLPLLIRGGDRYLWEEENFWGTAWREQNYVNELVPLIPALGEVEDISAVTVNMASSEDWKNVKPLADNYGLSDVMLAKATLTGEPPDQVLEVDMIRLSSLDDPKTVSRIRLKNTDALPLDQLAVLAIQQSVIRMQSNWKAETLVSPDAPSEGMDATVRFDNIKAWNELRKRISQIRLIQNFQVLALSRTGAELKFDYSGTLEQLKVALAQQRLTLNDTDTINVIELAESTQEGADGALVNGQPASDNGTPSYNEGAGSGYGGPDEGPLDVQTGDPNSQPVPSGSGYDIGISGAHEE